MNIRPLTQLRELIATALKSQANIGKSFQSFFQEDIDNYKERFYFCLKHLHELSDLPDGFAEGIWAKLARQSEFAEMSVNVKKEYIRKMTTVSLPLNNKVLLPVDTIDANCYCDCYVLTDLKNEIEILYNKWNECFHIK